MQGPWLYRTGHHLAAAAFLLGSCVWANPGSAGTAIVQTTGQAIINWSTLTVPAGSGIVFTQPSSSTIALKTIALNRITGLSTAQIFGYPNATGRVWIIEPSGSVAPRVAAASNLVLRPASRTPAMIATQTAISASTAHLPAALRAAPQPEPVTIAGDDLLAFATSADASAPALLAPSVKLASATPNADVLPAASLAQVLDNVINTCGIVPATSAAIVDGRVVLSGSGDGCR